jgi:AmmeMemoRadiSam system protein B
MTAYAEGAARRPAHAGTFYPADPARLAALVDRLLRGPPPPPVPGRLAGALVPHAGLEYSGPVAAAGWRIVAAARPATLVLLGTDHAGRAQGAGVWTGGPWIGPFGSVPVDERLAERLAGLGPPFAADDAAHHDEHSLEIQLPFVARLCPEARIVPVLVSPRSPETAEIAGGLLGGLLTEVDAADRRVIVVASTDFAHYPSEPVAREVGRRMIEPLLALDVAGLLAAERDVRRLPGVACGMCGLEPAVALVAALLALDARHGRVLCEATSADASAGDRRRTVGYAAMAYTGHSSPIGQMFHVSSIAPRTGASGGTISTIGVARSHDSMSHAPLGAQVSKRWRT